MRYELAFMKRFVTYFIWKLLGFVTFCNKVISWHQCIVPLWVGRYNKTLNDWSHGKQWVLFSLDLNVPLGFASRTLRVSGKQNSLFPSGPVIKCLMSHFVTLFIAQLHFILYNWRWMMFHPKHVLIKLII